MLTYGFYDTARIKIGPPMNGVLEASELRRWPLMNGNTWCGDELERIRREGLVAAGQQGDATNSFSYDRELGRTNFCFLAPASFKVNYGFGRWCILVDPVVLQKAGIRFADQDIGEAYDCIKTVIDGSEYIGGKVRRQDLLEKITRSEHISMEHESDDEMAMRVVRSAAFKDYYNRFWLISEADLFVTIEKQAKRAGFTMFDYFNRTGIWGLGEEILVPDRVEAEYLLGHWDTGRWTRWRTPKNRDTQNRVEEFIGTLTQLRG